MTTIHQDFPNITHVSQVLEAIKDSPNLFSVQHDTKHGLIFIKYKSVLSMDEAFPPLLLPTVQNSEQELEKLKIENTRRQLRRECRGLVFHQLTGQLLVRRFHKFFNLNERAECDVERIDFSGKRPFICLDKMDGSLISPVRMLSNSSAAAMASSSSSAITAKTASKTNIRFCTMLGFGQQAQMADDLVKYLKVKYQQQKTSSPKPFQYEEFCHYCMDNGMTPSFEFISAENKIVIKYQKSELILLCVRYNESGEYVPYAKLKEWANQYQIPLVKKWNDEDVPKGDGRALVDYVRRMNGIEGCVIAFTDNYEMYKCKTLSYAIAHQIHPQRIKERQIWKAVLSNVVDDLIALVDFDDRIRDALQKFRSEFESCLQRKLESLVKIMERFLSDNGQNLLNESIEKLCNKIENEYDRGVIQRVLHNNGASTILDSVQSNSDVDDKKELSDYILEELQQYLTSKYIDGAMRVFEQHREQLYQWLDFEFDSIHPFDFERSTGTLRIHKHALKSLSDEAYKKYVDLHFSMMSPKSKPKKDNKKKQDADILDEFSGPASIKSVVGRGKVQSFTKAKSQKKKGKKK